jgi:hypothetical protein
LESQEAAVGHGKSERQEADEGFEGNAQADWGVGEQEDSRGLIADERSGEEKNSR